MTLVYSGATVCTISFTYTPADHLDSVSTGELCVHKTDCKHLELRKAKQRDKVSEENAERCVLDAIMCMSTPCSAINR